ncbi:hypothetical protein SCA03_32890 [Streptomyces cacaoi]|uniref:Uncharacterized protein n=1 Tax=Streptomyces cacaoi TaxID=1898 RepID=A0A4Y3R211_STRCI|nr:hypothetical protein SCA03_32890 [Streptomyces cacaoi]
MRCRTVDSSVEKQVNTGEKSPLPVGGTWTTANTRPLPGSSSTTCGEPSPTNTQHPDLGKPTRLRASCGRARDNFPGPQDVDAANGPDLWIPARYGTVIEQRGAPRQLSRPLFPPVVPGGRPLSGGAPGGGREGEGKGRGSEADRRRTGSGREAEEWGRAGAVARCREGVSGQQNAPPTGGGWRGVVGVRRGAGEAGQAFLMRLVSSVTWL